MISLVDGSCMLFSVNSYWLLESSLESSISVGVLSTTCLSTQRLHWIAEENTASTMQSTTQQLLVGSSMRLVDVSSAVEVAGFEIKATAAVMAVESEAVAVPGSACRPGTAVVVVGIESAIVVVSTPLMTNKAKNY